MSARITRKPILNVISEQEAVRVVELESILAISILVIENNINTVDW